MLGLGSFSLEFEEVPHANINIMSKNTHRFNKAHNMLFSVSSTIIKFLDLRNKIAYGVRIAASGEYGGFKSRQAKETDAFSFSFLEIALTLKNHKND